MAERSPFSAISFWLGMAAIIDDKEEKENKKFTTRDFQKNFSADLSTPIAGKLTAFYLGNFTSKISPNFAWNFGPHSRLAVRAALE